MIVFLYHTSTNDLRHDSWPAIGQRNEGKAVHGTAIHLEGVYCPSGASARGATQRRHSMPRKPAKAGGGRLDAYKPAVVPLVQHPDEGLVWEQVAPMPFARRAATAVARR